ncbi:MAG: hypothetical protein PHQ62_00385 [Clostridia bacterium]|nr:hypothetical protein [Clostridia bacterium]
MNIYNYESFNLHLNKVCKNDFLKSIAMDFYLKLEEKNQTFCKEDFECLIVKDKDGTPKVFEQDIVKELFAKKNEAKLEEVFTYLFCNNIEKYDYNLGPVFEKKDATFDASKKELVIYQKIDKFVENEDSIIQKIILFHEFSHILETKTFKNRNIIYIGLNNYVSVKNFPSETFLLNSNHSLNLRKTYPSNKEWLKSIGTTSLSEVNNDFFSVMLCDRLVFIKNKFNKLYNQCFQNITYGAFVSKEKNFTSKYCKNFDMLVLLKYAIGEEIFSKNRFNTVNFINEINNLNVDKEYIFGVEEILKDLEVEKVSKSSIYNLLTINLGVARELEEMKNYDKAIYYKSQNQLMLINAIKNNTLAQFEDPLTKKDEKFFVATNNMLIDISNILIYNKKDPQNLLGPACEFKNFLESLNTKVEELEGKEKELANKNLFFLDEYQRATKKKEGCLTNNL